MIKESGDAPKEEIVPIEDIYESLNASDSDVLYIFADYQKAGGAVIHVDKENPKNEPALFYLYPELRSKEIGSSVWNIIEKMYLEARTWETVTPYFEKRNIHFLRK